MGQSNPKRLLANEVLAPLDGDVGVCIDALRCDSLAFGVTVELSPGSEVREGSGLFNVSDGDHVAIRQHVVGQTPGLPRRALNFDDTNSQSLHLIRHWDRHAEDGLSQPRRQGDHLYQGTTDAMAAVDPNLKANGVRERKEELEVANLYNKVYGSAFEDVGDALAAPAGDDGPAKAVRQARKKKKQPLVAAPGVKK